MGTNRKKYMRAYVEKNKDKLLRQKREHYLKNKVRYHARGREWKRNNPDKVRAADLKYTAAHPDAALKRARKWRADHKHELPAKRARMKYGITEAEHRRLMSSGCHICGTKERRLHVDHDHTTGAVRGALCLLCNVAIGNFKDDPELLRRALSYLGGSRENKIA